MSSTFQKWGNSLGIACPRLLLSRIDQTRLADNYSRSPPVYWSEAYTANDRCDPVDDHCIWCDEDDRVDQITKLPVVAYL
jgi:hypothetical protein